VEVINVIQARFPVLGGVGKELRRSLEAVEGEPLAAMAVLVRGFEKANICMEKYPKSP
jgi:hypothetical protein